LDANKIFFLNHFGAGAGWVAGRLAEFVLPVLRIAIEIVFPPNILTFAHLRPDS
jgi:hypothetical protein